MQKGKRFFHILATFLAILPIASCKMDGGDIKTTPQEEWQYSGNTLIIRTNVSAEGQTATNERSAVPSQLFDIDGKPLVFAGALYANGTQEKDKAFQQGECNDGRLTLAFEIVNEKEKDKEYTLEIRAYKGGTKPEFFKDISPLLSGTVPITISANASEINAPAVKLKPFEGTTEKGSIKLELLIPSEYVMFVHKGEFYPSIEPDEQENGYKKWTISADGIDAGIYEFDFLLYNSTETSVVYLWNEAINIYPGMTTDKWNSGNVNKDGARQIDKVRIFSTFYVKGENPQSDWFKKLSDSDTEENGSLSHPYTKIQDAIDRIREINDGSTPFSIYIDGTLTQNEAPSDNKKGMADFSALEKNLNLTIKSLSDTKATLDANKQSRVIYANPTSGILNLTLENLVITGGNVSDYGGGISFISNGGTLEIKNSEISNNTAPRDGGGVQISGSSTFKMNGCTISNNTTNGGNIGNGAGIYVENGVNATISNTTLSGNKAESNGGAIYADNNCNLTTENCTISGNSASGSSVTKGGGVYVTGSTFTMTGGTISEGNAKLGGGVFINSGKFIMNNGTTHEGSITRNTASQNGGGVYVSGGTFEMNDGKISSNKAEGEADSNGGGIYVAAGGTFTMTGGATISGNSVSGKGGGICSNKGKFTMSGGKIVDKNKAKYGGGVYVITDDANAFMMSNGEISNNEASEDGGGVYVKNTKFEMSDTAEISRNNAGYRGGGVYLDGNTFTMNGDAIVDNNTATYGGGVYVSGSTFTLRKGTISNNTARGNGGGVNVYGNKFIMEGGTISKNTASYNGGGVLIRSSAIFTMTGGTMSGGNAKLGGGVYIDGGTFKMDKEGTITGNTASQDGGGVYIYKDSAEATLTMIGGKINGNTATNNGGGVYNQDGTFTMSGDTISGNSATKGKGAYISGTFTMSGDAKFNKDDDVYLVNANKIHIAGSLNQDDVATITPYKYESGRQVLSADNEAIMHDNYSKFAVTSQTNNDNTKTKWKIEQGSGASTNYGILKQDNVSTGGDSGISVTLPDLGNNYTFNVTGISENAGKKILTSESIITLNEVKDSSENPPDAKKFTIEIQDTSGGTICSREGDALPVDVQVPLLLPNTPAQVYVKVVLKDGIVIEKTIPVTIGS